MQIVTKRLENLQSSLACNDSSSLQQTERFTAGTTWKLARISRLAGFVVRYLGLSATPPEFAEHAVSGATKDSQNPGPLPQVPCVQGLPFLQAGRLTTFFVVPDFLFLSRVTASRCTSRPDWTGLGLGGDDRSSAPAPLTACEWATSVSHGSHKGPVSSCDSISHFELLLTHDHPRHDSWL